MTEKYKIDNINFKKSAIYKIVVKGEINEEMSERLWGLQARKYKSENHKPITTIVGHINDQAALAGILNMLYDMHMTVISVNMLSEIEMI